MPESANPRQKLEELLQGFNRKPKVPTFIIIGAQKSGTTSLWECLKQHPEVAMSDRKELHYFDRERNYPDHAWYRSRFPVGARAVGEATPIYCYWPTAIERMREFDRSLKLIMLLRNPIDRAISHYWMEFERGEETLPIREAFEAEAGRLIAPTPHALRRYSYLARGRYHEQLDRIYRYFPAKQVLVCRLADLVEAPVTTLAEVYRFIGVSDSTPQAFLPHFQGSYQPSDESLRAYLRGYFDPHNEALAAKYGIRVDDWM